MQKNNLFKEIKFDLFNIIKVNKNLDVPDDKIYEIINIITDYFRFNEEDVANIILSVATKSEKDVDLTQYQIAKIPKEKRTLIYQYPNISYILFTILTHLSSMNLSLIGLKNSRSNPLFNINQFEKDINYLDKHIKHIEASIIHSKLVKNQFDEEKYSLALFLIKNIKKNRDKGINSLYLIYDLATKLNEKNITSENEIFFQHKKYISELYRIFASYKISPKKIHKSTALLIFNALYPQYFTNKLALCDMISHLFSRLDMEIQLDYRKAHNIKHIRTFYEDILYDYSTAKINFSN